MDKISELEFARICVGIFEDREIIRMHNPIGKPDEILLWMLLSCLVSYLSLTEVETPCFTGMPTSKTYHEAILFVLKSRTSEKFDAEKYISELIKD